MSDLSKSNFFAGIGDLETFQWIKSNKETKEKNLLAWVHTHVNGSLLEYSSIDVHNDYMIQEFVDPNVMGIGKPNF